MRGRTTPPTPNRHLAGEKEDEGAPTAYVRPRIFDEGLTNSALRTYPPAMEQICVQEQRFGDKGLRALLYGDQMDAVRRLELGFGGLTAASIVALAEARLPALQELWLRGAKIDRAAAHAFASSRFIPRLRRLHIDDCEIGQRAGCVMLRYLRPTSLRVLRVAGSGVGDRGVAAIANNPALQSLEVLDLRHNGIGDRGALALAESGSLRNLRSLRLDGNAISREGYRALAKSRRLPPELTRTLALDD